uniref:G-protein coupled receptors family 1 profile domain-containing protein n=1 Tax=Panagrolaimus sp. ES5 TaxID=591445 RepID=A0AC34F298_9BILA
MTSLCQFIESLPLEDNLMEDEIFSNLTLLSRTVHQDSVSKLNRITYAYIAPVIISFGVIGDILTVATLTHPLLRRSSIVYTYLTLLAMTDLLTHISVIPMILWLLDWRLCSKSSAIYYAHIGFPLANALMGASVWIVVFLTLSQYMAVCHPFNHGFFRKRKMCFWLFAAAYIFNFGIYAPWSTKKNVHLLPDDLLQCPYLICDRKKESWFQIYEWIREFWTRVFPFLLIAYFNLQIMITYRSTKRDRLRRLASSQTKRGVTEKSEQIIRAIVNLLEFTKFALNFYFYCLINPDIRRISWNIIQCRKLSKPARVKGQLINPISIYTRSTKSTVRALHGDSTRRSSRNEEYRRGSLGSNMRTRSASVLTNFMNNDNVIYDQLQVIKETDSYISKDHTSTNSSPNTSPTRLGDNLRRISIGGVRV